MNGSDHPDAPTPAREGATPAMDARAEADLSQLASAPGEADVGAAEALARAEAEIAQLKDEKLRALAEIENVRRRAARERQDLSQYAVSNFARDALSVADNLKRALAAVDGAARATDPALAALVNGVEMTERELAAILARHGVTPIAAIGAPFDPHLHEALFEVPDESVPSGTVVQVIEDGYLIHDRTLRPARVGVAKGGAKARPQSAETPNAADANGVTDFAAGRAHDPYRRAESGRPGGRVDERF